MHRLLASAAVALVTLASVSGATTRAYAFDDLDAMSMQMDMDDMAMDMDMQTDMMMEREAERHGQHFVRRAPPPPPQHDCLFHALTHVIPCLP